MKWQLTDIESDSLIDVSSQGELEERLRAMKNSCGESPQVVELVAENGNTLAVGIGNEMSYLNYVKADGWPAYSSLGDVNANGTLRFTMNRYFTEVPAKYGISFELAIQIAKSLFESGEMPDVIEWEENRPPLSSPRSSVQ